VYLLKHATFIQNSVCVKNSGTKRLKKKKKKDCPVANASLSNKQNVLDRYTNLQRAIIYD